MTEAEADQIIAQWQLSFNCGRRSVVKPWRPVVEPEIRRLIASLPFGDVQDAMEELLSTVDVVKRPKSSFFLNPQCFVAMLHRLRAEHKARIRRWAKWIWDQMKLKTRREKERLRETLRGIRGE